MNPDQFTFVLTDIEGSTRLWEAHSDAMEGVISEHDDLMRAVMESRLGHVFKTVGDMICAAFVSPQNAVEAAIEAQLELRKRVFSVVGQLNVRMAIYTGTARYREGDYFGTALNRASRLLANANGGQILVSSDTASFLVGHPIENVSVRDLGNHKLRDVDAPEQVFQVLHPELPSEFKNNLASNAEKSNLPRELSTFVGREVELTEVRKLVRSKNLVTLIGSGGCGKTRLALQVAFDLETEFDDGIWFIEFATVSDPQLLAQTVMSAMNLPSDNNLTADVSIKSQLTTMNTLLIFDNCEHVVAAAANLADQITKTAPNVRILATSREALGVNGETTWRVRSLSVPEQDTDDTELLLEESEAVRLFVERAVASNSTFELTKANAPNVVAICRRLDGIPLALELAAARAKALPVEQIASRLDDRFRLLTGGSRTALPRQQTLRALIDWSYNLLVDNEKLLLRRLSVFTGGWTLDAAEKVAGAEPLDQFEVMDQLALLVDKSLVTYEQPKGRPRYRLLETVRQYAVEKLFDTDEADATRSCHAEYFADFIKEKQVMLLGKEQQSAMQAISDDHENLRAALEWFYALDSGKSKCLEMAKNIGRYWELCGNLSEGRKLLERVLQNSPDEEEDMRMRVLNQLGNIRREQGDYAAAEEAFRESLVLAEKLEFKIGIAVLRNNLGITNLNLLRLPEAKEEYERSIEVCREIGDETNLASALDNLTSVYLQTGDFDQARKCNDESFAIFERRGDERGMAISSHLRADVERNAGNLEFEAKAIYAFQIMTTLGLGLLQAAGLELLGYFAADKQEYERATCLFGAGARMRERLGVVLPPQSKEEYEHYLKLCEEKLGKDKFNAETLGGRQMQQDRLIEFATRLTDFAKSSE